MPNETSGKFQKWLSTLPSTNLQTIVGLGLAAEVVQVLLIALLLGRTLQEAVVNSVLIFVGAMLGFSVGQFIGKRATQDADIMNAQAAIDENKSVRTTVTEQTVKTTERSATPSEVHQPTDEL